MSNKWLNSTVTAYKRYFGEVFEPIIYEVGSRDGNDGIELAERIVDGILAPEQHRNVVLFEPNPPSAQIIEDKYPNATLLMIAASNKNGKAQFVQILGNKDEIGSSSMDLGRQKTKTGIKRLIEVDTRRLDEVIGELEHITIDIMKIDAEGYTLEILQGLGERLADIRVLHLETELPSSPTMRHSSQEVWDFMAAAGFLCYAREYEWGDLEDQVWVNAEMLRCAK